MKTDMHILERLTERYPSLSGISGDIYGMFALLRDGFAAGNKLLVAGNGGSRADADHIAGELMKGFTLARPLSEDRISVLESINAKGKDIAEHLQRGLPSDRSRFGRRSRNGIRKRYSERCGLRIRTAGKRSRQSRRRIPRHIHFGQFAECGKRGDNGEGIRHARCRAHRLKRRRAFRFCRRCRKSPHDGVLRDPGTSSACVSHRMPDVGKRIFRRKEMKILHVCNYYKPHIGGIEQTAEDIVGFSFRPRTKSHLFQS